MSLDEALDATPEQLFFLFGAWQKRLARERVAFVQDVFAAVAPFVSESGSEIKNDHLDGLFELAGMAKPKPAVAYTDITALIG